MTHLLYMPMLHFTINMTHRYKYSKRKLSSLFPFGSGQSVLCSNRTLSRYVNINDQMELIMWSRFLSIWSC